jgi:hypothetical protein
MAHWQKKPPFETVMHVAPFWQGDDEQTFEACYNLKFKFFLTYTGVERNSEIRLILRKITSINVNLRKITFYIGCKIT